ncbi:MAG: winged helix-turn-helix domain-containing protein [Candidatus Baltobacteraceae bacterium]
MADLSKDEARRIALFAQGFYDPRPAATNRAALKRVLNRTNLFQIDSVNVLVRSHYLPLFTRLGSYPVSLLQEAAWGPLRKRLLFEYWAHEASLVPLQYRPLLMWRMERARHGRGMWQRMADIARKRKFVDSILKQIQNNGAASASAFKKARGTGSWWGWSDVKIALEYLFWAGYLTAATRTNSFERVYDLPERVFSREVLDAPIPDEREAHRQLMLLSLRAMGVATQADLRDYFRLDLTDARHALGDLVEAGAVQATSVEGWKQPAYIFPGTRIPRKEPMHSGLLSPFDSLIWNRDRAHRLFNFHYRIEIYTPAHKRIHGYYVLPFLHNGNLVARVDLKADRAGGRLEVKNTVYETSVAKRAGERALREQLKTLGSWLDL